jgi:hypothetical protein
MRVVVASNWLDRVAEAVIISGPVSAKGVPRVGPAEK